jgi:diadenosine tetraphosphate (Ap4A) HIT family hydrolase
VPDCIVCRKHAGELPLPGGFLHEDELVLASHVFDLEGAGAPTYLGHLIVESRRHVPSLADLTAAEAAAVGRLVTACALALREGAGAEHVYSAVMGHNAAHLHVHVFARYPGTPREFWFTRVDEWPEAPTGGPAEISALTDRLRPHLHF